MTSLSSEVIVDSDGKHRVALKFNLEVHEYLKGTGPSNIVAVWVDDSYDTQAEAEDRKAAILGGREDPWGRSVQRDAQWDDREAVIFLYGEGSGFGASLDGQLKLADHFLLYVADPYSPDDFYSLHSREQKRWLPASSVTASGASSGDDREFLLDVPPAAGASGANSSSAAPTITLSNLKKRILEVMAKLNGGDGSEAYKQCVREKYQSLREERYFRELDGSDLYGRSPMKNELTSGQPANTVLHQRQNHGIYLSQKAKTWFEGRDATLFIVVQGEPTPVDYDGDGRFTAAKDGIVFTETFMASRPLPSGEYKFDLKEVWSPYFLCNYEISLDWTVTVTAPAGTAYETMFDPTAVDGAVKAASVLKPYTAPGADTATVSDISWKSGTLKIKFDPVTAHTGHVLNFIDIDGDVALSLALSGATVDAAAKTLSWSVSSQPWKVGDKMMVRIHDGSVTPGR